MKYLDNFILVNGHAGGMICLPLYKTRATTLAPKELSVETRDVTVVYILIAWDQ